MGLLTSPRASPDGPATFPPCRGAFRDDAATGPVYHGTRRTPARRDARARAGSSRFVAPRAGSAYRAGTCSSGIGVAAKRRLSGMASHRAQAAARDTRALSVAMPVLPYIWRYSFDTSMNASR